MADVKISQLPAATTPVAGTEVLPIVQGGTTSKVAISDLTAGRAVSMTSATLSSNLAFTGTGNRITGDFSNATAANRVAFQTSTVNSNTVLTVIPNGTSDNPSLLLENSSSPANNGFAQLTVDTASTSLRSGIRGTGTYVPMTFFTGGGERVRIDTAGNVGIGTSSPGAKLDVAATTAIVQIDSSAGTAGAAVTRYKASNRTYVTGVNATDATGAYTVYDVTATTERMRIDSSGNVGIGTSSLAGYRVSVKQSGNTSLASVGIASIDSANDTYIGMGYNATSDTCRILASYDTGGAYKPITFLTTDIERMRIATNGIVTMSAYGAGTATFSAAGVISSVSDETWKIKDGVPVNPDAMLKKLEPGYWYYNDEKKESFGADRQLGFYAQNVNAAIGPEAAPEPEEGKSWGYYDRSVLAVVVMSLQKALATIELLEARVAAFESN